MTFTEYKKLNFNNFFWKLLLILSPKKYSGLIEGINQGFTHSTKAIMAKIKACYLQTELIVSKVSFWYIIHRIIEKSTYMKNEILIKC